ncbi:YaaR family protein [Alteribacter natronophilus]|uniref:YaaR family protein n=1 Tax=Alteribacter natronophilus TaxID=2583810 RepID=UPI00110D5059|nr:YaaR family protein [Alteribacter natronophilus]TMW73715.1 DUF327 family protein [Alteribacter natronophilus]
MEIQKTARKPLAGARSVNKNTGGQGTAFQDMLQKDQQKHSRERFEAMAAKIEEQGERLSRTRTAGDLRSYRKLVAGFMNDAVAYALSLEESGSRGPAGNSKVYRLVRQVDDELAKLTEQVLGESGGLPILEQTGTIKGLLVNLYT